MSIIIGNMNSHCLLQNKMVKGWVCTMCERMGRGDVCVCQRDRERDGEEVHLTN